MNLRRKQRDVIRMDIKLSKESTLEKFIKKHNLKLISPLPNIIKLKHLNINDFDVTASGTDKKCRLLCDLSDLFGESCNGDDCPSCLLNRNSNTKQLQLLIDEVKSLEA